MFRNDFLGLHRINQDWGWCSKPIEFGPKRNISPEINSVLYIAVLLKLKSFWVLYVKGRSLIPIEAKKNCYSLQSNNYMSWLKQYHFPEILR